ncbi:MAG: hypothetical protein RL538_42 [Candidatus Parcubacteria bacterium]
MPPPLDQAWLRAKLIDTFYIKEKGDNNPDLEARQLMSDLVHAYLMWWVLMITFPERRIVGTAPLWEVRRIHASELERFLSDCLGYLGRIPQKKDLWRGPLDFRGTHETARSVHELFDYPDLVWEPILRTAREQRDEKIIRLH